MKNKKEDICIIGVSNIDFHITSMEKLKSDTSVFGDIYISPGGVGRNIAHCLSSLKTYVSFISIFSTDSFSKLLLKDLENRYISLSESVFNADNTSKYANLIINGEVYGINDIKNLKEFSIPFFKKKIDFLNNVNFVVLDVNMDESSLIFIAHHVKSKLICEATSSVKCKKLKSVLNSIYLLKANYIEACIIADCKHNISFHRLLETIIKKGVEKTYITLGSKGALYADGKSKLYAKIKNPLNTNNTTGAGDTFMAGIIYGERMGWSCEQVLIFSINLVFCYLSCGRHKLDDESVYKASNMKKEIVDIYYWDEANKVWKEKREWL